ncbi:MAG: C25 family cysteine peptidase [Salinivirgaceae bacterium]|nr:C25 family cysteine peptidase [Salinivirgaceae bacterium]
MRRYIPVIVFIITICFVNGYAQPTDNWVSNAQSYYRIKNSNNGVVRISATSLIDAGVPVSSFAPQNIQLFYRGDEIPIFIKGESQGTIEYIEFVASKNDGWFDTGMYVTALSQINPHISLISDTSSYFLTWNSSFSNRRYQLKNYQQSTTNETLITARKSVIYAARSRFCADELDPELGSMEGYYTLPLISKGGTTSRTIELPGKIGQGEVFCSTAIGGANNAATETGFNHHLQIKHGSKVLLDTLFRGYQAIKSQFALNASTFGQSLVLNYSSINDQSVAQDLMGVAYVTVDYPADFTLSPTNFATYTIQSSSDTRQLFFQGLTASEKPTVYDASNNLNLVATLTSQGWGITIPPTSNDVVLNVAVSPTTVGASMIKSANMQVATSSSDYVVVSHTSLMQEAQQYAAFRGGFAVDIEQLYNRYAYGIQQHPLAIRYFLQSHIAKGNVIPSYLFIIGKGIDMLKLHTSPNLIPNNLIPVPGVPSTDMLITSRLTRSSPIPEVMVGRLAATTGQQVLSYLAKAQEHTARKPSLGAKNILHFGGGANIAEQTMFANYLKKYETIITDTLFGGFVSTFLKNSSAPIVITQSDSVRSIIEQGPLLLTFFGHSWTGGFDQNIDEPENFNNRGNYPLIIANSCYSGNIYKEDANTTSEKWVLIPQKGAIAFLASVHLGYPNYLNRYTEEFYNNVASLSYGQSYGKSIMQAINTLMTTQPSLYMKSNCLEFVFHGDPAVTPVAGHLPDPLLSDYSLSLIPRNVSTAIDSFAIQVVVTNVGRTVNRSLQIDLQRLLPNGSTQDKVVTLDKLYYQDTVLVYFPVDRYNGVGQNRILVTLDNNNEIEELSELNNHKTIVFNVSSTDIFPIYPQNFGLVDKNQIVLKSSTGNPFEESQLYHFQLDTVSDFSSPFLQSSMIESVGGVVDWTPTASLETDKPYFWRVVKNTTDNNLEWNESSFTLNSEKSGWRQFGKNQMQKNNLRFLEYGSGSNLQYIVTPRVISCLNIGSITGEDVNFINYDIDGNGDYGSCRATASIVLAVIDSLTLLPWKSDRGDYGHMDYPKCSGRNRPNNYFTFPATVAGRDAMSQFLVNVVEEGSYVLAYSAVNAAFETWNSNHYEAFELLGATRIRTVPNDFPYIFLGRKGEIGFAEEVVGATASSTIRLEKTLVSNFYYGTVLTPYIGPAKEWKTLHWSPESSQLGVTDSVVMKVYGKSSLSTDSLIVTFYVQDTLVDLNFLNNSSTPYIKLEYFTYDLEQKTPVSPRLFEVEYVAYPELALNPKGGFAFHANEISEGDSLLFGVELLNVSTETSGTFPMKYICRSIDAKVVEEKTVVIDSMPAMGSVFDTVKFNTRNRQGINQIQIEVNYPDEKSVYFPEPFTFNNLGWRSFTVLPDNREPLLSVTFDGRYIMNSEIVNSRPTVEIKMLDQNQFILLNDTSLIQIWLTRPETQTAERVWFTPLIAGGDLIWEPASMHANECKIRWTPQFDVDGIYELRVRATDPSGNQAGSNDYRVQFEIVNKSTITNLLNYPNPFSTRTQFVFTITGHILPDELRIQIFTVSGRVVRDINLSELSTLRIGQNLTDFAWDGTDDFGDRLANGVYFYRVISKINGQNIEHRDSDADKFFKKEFGKMYLIK